MIRTEGCTQQKADNPLVYDLPRFASMPGIKMIAIRSIRKPTRIILQDQAHILIDMPRDALNALYAVARGVKIDSTMTYLLTGPLWTGNMSLLKLIIYFKTKRDPRAVDVIVEL